MKQGNAPAMKNARKQRALNRLAAQLTSGVKNENDTMVPLSEHDVKRITKEIEVLKGRVVSKEQALRTSTKKYRGPR